MKKIASLIFLTLALSACSNAESEPTYTVEDAQENGDVIVEHQVEEFEQIRQGALEVENSDQISTLVEKAKNGESYTTNVSIFNPDGSHFQNRFETNGETVQFENEYSGYPNTPAGSFTCEYIEERGQIIYVSNCESKSGETYSTLIGYIGKQ
ncbi:membrane lipoprotein lipid attachment site-containing protein [Halobacillus litoralis]|uniref:membrane lipoprotein lipid attachment site-containing protein n=1 Tax=Halobacillus litoralis TaxID=45668 RepID=UPI001CD328B8|nr:membrane lipoprotein lipid attachment site-containing protein [Halobacillus litoralis]MCA0972502.1 membrane lipoprotein lipid attachment site-containing protein [Halobacillus litoralis]